MGMATEALALLLTELMWNVVVWLPTLVFTYFPLPLDRG